jgi:hypothetical protein
VAPEDNVVTVASTRCFDSKSHRLNESANVERFAQIGDGTKPQALCAHTGSVMRRYDDYREIGTR